jgi:hypothetical protein
VFFGAHNAHSEEATLDGFKGSAPTSSSTFFGKFDRSTDDHNREQGMRIV